MFLRGRKLGGFGFNGNYNPPKIKCPDTTPTIEVVE